MLIAKTHFQSTRLGNVKEGDPVPDDDYAQELKRLGLVWEKPNSYQTKVVRQTPTVEKVNDSNGEDSAASGAGDSGRGKKSPKTRRKRKPSKPS